MHCQAEALQVGQQACQPDLHLHRYHAPPSQFLQALWLGGMSVVYVFEIQGLLAVVASKAHQGGSGIAMASSSSILAQRPVVGTVVKSLELLYVMPFGCSGRTGCWRHIWTLQRRPDKKVYCVMFALLPASFLVLTCEVT